MRAAIAEARTAPQLARHGALFVLALWGRHFPVYPQEELPTPVLHAGAILLPSAWRIEPHGAELYRAAACHAAAHLIHAGALFLRGELKPRQQVLIGLFEDARVEALAMARFPGLRRLWQRFHPPAQGDGLAFPRLLRRLARALLLGEVDAGNAWVNKAVAEFHGQSRRWTDPALARELGLRLAHDLGQMRIAMDEGQAFQVAPYRDDNAHLWADEEASLTSGEPRAAAQISSIQESVQWREARGGRRLALADRQGPAAEQASWWLRDDPDQALVQYHRHAAADVDAEYCYPEWNYRAHVLRRDWCRVRATRPAPGDADLAARLLREQRPVLARLRHLALSLRLERLQRVRRQTEGDELDLAALLEAQADVRKGREPDPRLYFRARPHHDRGLASLVLLDLSESCNDPLPEAGHSLLELSRVAALLLGHTLETLGEAFALQGFNSNGRHQVDCQHIKDFEEPFDAVIEARIAGLGARHSTRLGAALRHGLAQLGRRREHFRLLLVVTDGAPADIDVHDEDYLTEDVRAAVREGRRQGMELYCLSLDAGARERMEKMFGAGRFRLLDHPGRLPELLPQLLLSLTRRY